MIILCRWEERKAQTRDDGETEKAAEVHDIDGWRRLVEVFVGKDDNRKN